MRDANPPDTSLRLGHRARGLAAAAAALANPLGGLFRSLAGLAALFAALTGLAVLAGNAAAEIAPLPESSYSVRPACATPSPGSAGCLALQLHPETATARARTHPIGMRRDVGPLAGRAREGAYGYRPIDLRNAYLPGEEPLAPEGSPQTIALVDAYNDYEASKDLTGYSEEFGLPKLSACATSKEGDCFERVGQEGPGGPLPFPAGATELTAEELVCLGRLGTKLKWEKACIEVEEAEGWAVEISTDIEMAHAVCQNCKVLLVEADTSSYSDLAEAEETAAALGATEVSNSWGGGEIALGSTGRQASEEAAALVEEAAAFRHPGVVITASAGDSGYLDWAEREEAERALARHEETGYTDTAEFPASDPEVVAVGGTQLRMSGSTRTSESVWNEESNGEEEGAGGGGCSSVFAAPSWQRNLPDWAQVGCGEKRAVADVAAVADPVTGVAVYDTVPYESVTDKPWLTIGGTSVASPIVASMFALAGGDNGAPHPAETLYEHRQTTAIYAVSSGGNGKCDGEYLTCAGSLEPVSPLYPLDCGEGALICNAAEACAGGFYSGPVGVGSPNGIAGFERGEQPQVLAPECTAKTKTSPGGGSAGSGTVPTPAPLEPPSRPTEAKPGSPTQPSSPARLLFLELTHAATAAARHHRAALRQIRFAIALSAGSEVQVTLERHVRRHDHAHWRKLPDETAFSAPSGTSRHALSDGRRRLPKGRYRLTVRLADGATRSRAFTVR